MHNFDSGLTFLGLLAVNIARELFKTAATSILLATSSLVAVLALVFGQGISELLQGTVPLTVIIDIVGCSYMFYLILMRIKKDDRN
ncbi:MAG: iron chelate uptake ABC transporter family permease subunit [Christensenellaceae bacterium]|jgi:iron complex transport system permease protein|nr:iron chelate uptake ABC transporter family permease subunit [Christensenellaceae bacterium]